MAFHRRAAAAQSCRELYDHGFKSSGKYLIDPDSRYSGTSSFEVYCDFEKNNTVVEGTEKTFQFANNESSLDIVEYLNLDGNYNKAQSLIGSSGSCYQTLKTSCTNGQFLSPGQIWWIGSGGECFKRFTHACDNRRVPYILAGRWPFHLF